MIFGDSYMLQEFLKSRVGVILISIFWGLGLSALFKKSCTGNGRRCYVVHHRGPNPNEVAKNVYQYGTNKCYKYHPHLAQC